MKIAPPVPPTPPVPPDAATLRKRRNAEAAQNNKKKQVSLFQALKLPPPKAAAAAQVATNEGPPVVDAEIDEGIEPDATEANATDPDATKATDKGTDKAARIMFSDAACVDATKKKYPWAIWKRDSESSPISRVERTQTINKVTGQYITMTCFPLIAKSTPHHQVHHSSPSAPLITRSVQAPHVHMQHLPV